MNYKIYTCYHDDKLIKEYNLVNDEHHILYPTHKNIEGINLNYFNIVLSEFCAYYYIWKNNKYYDFIGLEHYRRKFDMNNIPELKEDECLVRVYSKNMPYTIKKQYIDTLGVKDFYIYEEILDKLYGVNNEYVNMLINSKDLIWDSVVMMSYNNFNKLCEFLFNVYDEFDKKINGNYKVENYLNFYDNNYIMRPHMLERLVGVWTLLNFDKNKIYAQYVYDGC